MYRIIGADGKEYGPISAEQLRQWIAEGRAAATTPVLAPGATEWKTLSSVPEFSLLFAAPQPARPVIYAPRQSNGFATASLVLGIISFFMCCCCYGLPFNVTGLIFALVALGQMREDPERYSGKAMAIAGLVLCALSLALGGCLLFFGILNASFNGPSHHVYRL